MPGTCAHWPSSPAQPVCPEPPVIWFPSVAERDGLGIVQMNWLASRTGGITSFYQRMVIKHFQSEQLLLDVMFGIRKGWLEPTQATCCILENVHMLTCARGHSVLYPYNERDELLMGTSLTGTVMPGKLGDSHLYFLFCVNSVTLLLQAGVNRSYKAALDPASFSTHANAVLRCRSIDALESTF